VLLRIGLLLLCTLLLSSAGCQSGADGDKVFGSPMFLPAVSGIVIRDEAGQVVANWGNPVDGGLEFFPNPIGNTGSMEFIVPAPGLVAIWISKAVGPGETVGPAYVNIAGAGIVTPPSGLVVTLLNERLIAGRHVIAWRGEDSAGNRVADGYYRIYAYIDGQEMFADIYCTDPQNPSFPSGMESLLGYYR